MVEIACLSSTSADFRVTNVYMCLTFSATKYLQFSIVDIDECNEVPGACSQLCQNSQGSYTCKCADGYAKAPDGGTCKKKDGVVTF